MEGFFENRAVVSELTKPVMKGKSLSGYWLPFNVLSQPLFGERAGQKIVFREIIPSSALDVADLSNVKCCLNHDDKNEFLGRVPNTLKIGMDDKGMTFECELPNLEIGNKVIEFTNRGDYQGNSFRYLTMAGDDTCERQADDTYIRTVNRIRAIVHIGPVFDPAFTETDLTVAMRSLEESGLFKTEKLKVTEEEKEKEVEESLIDYMRKGMKAMRGRKIDIMGKY